MTPCLIVSLLALAAVFHQPTEPIQATAPEVGAVAPVGCWTTAGGSASHSGLSASSPVLADPELAWTFDAKGEIESEPLTWNEEIVLTVRTSAYKATIHVLDRWTGRQTSTTTIPAELPLEPSLWEDVLAVRPASDRLELYRITPRRLLPLRTIQTTEASGPILFEGQVFFADGAEIACVALDQREERWRKRIKGKFRGRPALRGDYVYAAWYDEKGYGHLACIERETGDLQGDIVFGHHGGAIPKPGDRLELCVFEREIFLQLPLAIATDTSRSFTTVRVGRKGRRMGDAAGGSSVHEFRTDPVEWNQGWIVGDRMDSDTLRWVASFTEGIQTRSIVLADSDNHTRLIDSRAGMSGAGDVYYLDDMAVASDDFRILWKSGQRPLLRPVPSDECVLIVPDRRRLVCLRTPFAKRSPVSEEAERIVQRLEAELAEALAGLVLRAVRIGAKDLGEDFLAEAVQRGASDRSLQTAAGALATPARSRQRRDERGERALLAERERMTQGFHEKLLYRAKNTREQTLSRTLLGELIRQAPKDSAVSLAVREMLPADAPVSEPFDASSWLEFMEVQGETPVSFIEPNQEEYRRDGKVETGEEILAREVRGWREDLYGYRTDRLFIVTPPSRPGAVARCLEVGELVCEALEDLFGGRTAVGANELVLLLYETEEEYHNQSQREGSRPELARGWSGGHYSPTEGISRMYVPDDRRPDRLLGVYAHELTHHWLAARSPFASRGWRARADARGYWIAEGFATMVEEFRFLPDEDRWDWNNPKAESLDVVANATEGQLLPWDEFFSLSQAAFHELDDSSQIMIPLSWRLGAKGHVSQIRLFYAQAGAASHYLLRAENGRHREALLKTIEDWSLGKHRTIKRAYGLDPEELGRRIVAFAKETVEGL